MAEVFSNDMVAHVWAQQRQPHGRSNNGNFYFSGRVLYSYGSHYPVGIIIAPGGPVFLNSSRSSITTEGKHKSAARAAVRHMRALYLPALADVESVILRAASSGGRIPANAPEHHAQSVESYLAGNWESIPADSEGAAWLLRAVGSRKAWPAMRARLKAKADAKAASNAARLKAVAIARGRELAAEPWPLVRADAWASASGYRSRGLRDLISEHRESRLATPKAHKRVRAALWHNEKRLRAMLERVEADSDRHGNTGERTKARAVLGRLYRFKAGAIGHVPGYDGPDGPDKLAAALALPTGAGWRALANMLAELARLPVHMPPAMRAEALGELYAKADAIATEREGEETQRREIAEARRRVRLTLHTFNRARRTLRHHRRNLAAEVEAGSITAYGANRALARSIDSVIHSLPTDRPWGAERGFELRPYLAHRAARIAARAADIVAPLHLEREGLRNAIERAFAAEREREAAERARIAAMSDADKLEAWQAGNLDSSHVRYLESGRGPLLRAKGAEIDGCTVTGGTLETSQGATVPLRHAFRVFQFVAACRAAGRSWTQGTGWGPRQIRVGHFSLDRIAPTGDFVAGCHSIRWPEIEALASRLGVADCLAPLEQAAAEVAA